MSYKYPLMNDSIDESDINNLISFLQQRPIPRLTQSEQVKLFEQEWSEWLGVKYSVFVNSGTMANYMTMSVLKHMYGNNSSKAEIIVPALTWVSDIVSVINTGFKPVFVDIDLKTLSMDEEEIYKKITSNTKAVFVTYAQGFNCLSDKLLDTLKAKNILLIEDVCESHGATYNNIKLGSIGWVSNFSFYFAHHMSTIEGGMVCTNDHETYNNLLMARSHGMVREAKDEEFKQKYYAEYPELNPEFMFAFPGYNGRGSELTAVLGRSQLNKLDNNNQIRAKNLKLFLENLDSSIYFTDYDQVGNSNYALPILLNKNNQMNIKQVKSKLISAMQKAGIEYRAGSAGGGNQLRQPYIQDYVSNNECLNYPNVEHVHHYGFYIGNYPGLDKHSILEICTVLNNI